MIPLSKLKKGKSARIVSFTDDSLLAFSCIEMGLCINSIIELVDKLHFGGNLVVLSDNGKYSLRQQEANQIMVQEITR